MSKRYYITTAIDYVNGQPHLGHAYEKLEEYAQAIEYYLQSLTYAPEYELTRKHLAACLAPCMVSFTLAKPNIAQLLIQFKDSLGKPDLLENAAAIRQFLSFWETIKLCQESPAAVGIIQQNLDTVIH